MSCKTVRVIVDALTSSQRSAADGPSPKKFSAEISENSAPVFGDGLSRRERWLRDIARDETVDMLIRRMAGGETFLEVCWERGWHYKVAAAHVARDEELAGALHCAEMLYADHLIKSGTRIVDGADFETVAVAKLRSEWRKWLAAKVNRQRYGEKVDVSGSVEHRHSLISILSGIGAEIDVTPALSREDEI